MNNEKEDMEVTLPPLLNAAAAASGFSIEQIKSKSRHQPLPFVRYMLFDILCIEYQWSNSMIGRAFNRDHATICTGMKKYREIMSADSRGYQVEHIINDNFNQLLMLPNKERRIRRYMNDIRKIINDLPQGKANAISNKLDRISLELKKDRPENRIKQQQV